MGPIDQQHDQQHGQPIDLRTPSACPGLVARAGRRPRTLAVLVGMLVCLALGVSSCRSTGGGAIPRSPTLQLPAEPEVRVRIRQNVERVVLTAAGPMVIEPLGPSGPVGVREIVTGPATIVGGPQGLLLTDRRQRRLDYPGLAGIQVSVDNPGDDPAKRLRVDNNVYPGVLWLIPKPAGQRDTALPVAQIDPAAGPVVFAAQTSTRRGAQSQPRTAPAQPPAPSRPASPPALRFDVIEIVPMETYLVGVVPSEMFPDWPVNAFEVQAVAARTYALQERQRSRELGQVFDLESTVLDQAYGGASDNRNALQAVRSTRGVVLTHQGRLIRAYYSSTCGGRSASAAEVWPTGAGFEFNLAPPLQGRPREHACQPARFYRWEVQRDRLELSRRIRAWGERAGHPARRLGPIVGVEVIQRNPAQRPSRYRLTDETGRTADLSAEELRVASNMTVQGLPEITGQTRVRSGDFEIAFAGAQVRITGRGFGHGVGMCQWCAKVFADRGEPWHRNILRFYPGAKLERVY